MGLDNPYKALYNIVVSHFLSIVPIILFMGLRQKESGLKKIAGLGDESGF